MLPKVASLALTVLTTAKTSSCVAPSTPAPRTNSSVTAWSSSALARRPMRSYSKVPPRRNGMAWRVSLYPSLSDILLGFGAPYITIVFMFLNCVCLLVDSSVCSFIAFSLLGLKSATYKLWGHVIACRVMSLHVVLCNGVSGQCKSMFMCMFMFMVIGWVRWGG